LNTCEKWNKAKGIGTPVVKKRCTEVLSRQQVSVKIIVKRKEIDFLS
jgi:hypothetical protein